MIDVTVTNVQDAIPDSTNETSSPNYFHAYFLSMYTCQFLVSECIFLLVSCVFSSSSSRH